MSGFGTQDLNKVSDYDDKLITDPINQWQFFGGYFRKLFKPLVFEYILNFRPASCLFLALKILMKYQTTVTSS
jgi:hypothetical protein